MKEIKTPVIIKMIRYANGENNHWQYYISGNYIKYITRNSACFQNPNIEETNLYNVNEEKFYDHEEMNKLLFRFKVLNEKQNVWDFVISFDKNFEKQNVLQHPELVNEIIKDPLENLFEKNHMNMNKYEVFFALHKNTDHLHIHLGFFETEPLGFRNNQPYYKHRGLLADKNIKEFKEFNLDVLKKTDDKYYKEMVSVRRFLVEETRNQMKQNNLIDYKNLVDHFIKNDIHTFQFKKLNEKNQEIVTNLINKIIHNNDELFKNYKEYQNTLKNLYEIKTERNYSYKVKGMDIPLDEWYQNQKDDIDIRIANGILKELKEEIPENNNTKNNRDFEVQKINNSNLENDSISNELDFEDEFIDNVVLNDIKDAVKESLAKSIQNNLHNDYDSNAPNFNFNDIKNDAVKSEHSKSTFNLNNLIKKMNFSINKMKNQTSNQYKDLSKELDKKLREGEDLENDIEFNY